MKVRRAALEAFMDVTYSKQMKRKFSQDVHDIVDSRDISRGETFDNASPRHSDELCPPSPSMKGATNTQNDDHDEANNTCALTVSLNEDLDRSRAPSINPSAKAENNAESSHTLRAPGSFCHRGKHESTSAREPSREVRVHGSSPSTSPSQTISRSPSLDFDMKSLKLEQIDKPSTSSARGNRKSMSRQRRSLHRRSTAAKMSYAGLTSASVKTTPISPRKYEVEHLLHVEANA